jgi:hypothetical protein
MDEDFEQWMAQTVASLSPEEYRRFGPALQDAGLALAEMRQAQHEAERVREAYARLLEDLDRAEERLHNALRLWRDAE